MTSTYLIPTHMTMYILIYYCIYFCHPMFDHEASGVLPACWWDLISSATHFSSESTWQSCGSSVNCSSTADSDLKCLNCFFVLFWFGFFLFFFGGKKNLYFWEPTTLICRNIIWRKAKRPQRVEHTFVTYLVETSALLWHHKGPVSITLHSSSHIPQSGAIKTIEGRIFLFSGEFTDILETHIVVSKH